MCKLVRGLFYTLLQQLLSWNVCNSFDYCRDTYQNQWIQLQFLLTWWYRFKLYGANDIFIINLFHCTWIRIPLQALEYHFKLTTFFFFFDDTISTDKEIRLVWSNVTKAAAICIAADQKKGSGSCNMVRTIFYDLVSSEMFRRLLLPFIVH